MKLDYIKKNLAEKKASVMVGAGFSKNADMDESVVMKDWNALASDFYERLYSIKPTPEKMMFKTPMRLASQVEASFGKNALYEFILESLPDNRIIPSDLHASLLKLPWRDVFTTNYDTLLERAQLDNRSYTIVTNKETLFYQSSPRIVKLHGSFPDIRPFIITEEDYRTYPDKYPEFVNTVRQALIENVFCLIGFSGEDPNFLSWLGWLRDVMGKHMAPVYWIIFDPELHDSNQKLMSERGIDIVNLNDIDGLNDFRVALAFFFKYLGEIEPTGWNDIPVEFKLNTPEEISETIEKMKKVRSTYPGWLLLPTEFFDDFGEIDMDFPFWDKFVAKMELHQKLAFIKELDWRLGISLTPRNITWYVETLESLINTNNEDLSNQEQESLNILRVSLLSVYRQKGKRSEFEKLFNDLKNNNNLKSSLLRKIYYERALEAIYRLDYSLAIKILSEWEILPTDYVGVLWKSVVYAEIGDKDNAIALLNDALHSVKTSILKNKGNSEFLKSCQFLIQNLIMLYDGYSIKNFEIKSNTDSGYSFIEILENLKDEIIKGADTSGVYRIHNFNINDKQITWKSGISGFNREYLNIYRFVQLYEAVGYPFGLCNMTINGDDFQTLLPKLMEDETSYVLSVMIRSCNKKLVESCLTRTSLLRITRKQANEIFDEMIEWCEKYSMDKNEVLQKRIFHVIIPLLSKLCVKLSSDRILKLFQYHKTIYYQYQNYYDSKLVACIYNCLNDEDLLKIINELLECSIQPLRNKDILFPSRGYEKYTVSDSSLEIIEQGLYHDSEVFQNCAYDRLVKIWDCVLSEEQIVRITQIVCKWRSGNNLSLIYRYSYNMIPYNKSLDVRNSEEICNQDVDALLKQDYTYDRSSSYIQNLDNNLGLLKPNLKVISLEQHELIIEKIKGFLEDNEERLKFDDANSFFGGMRRFCSDLFFEINYYITHANLKGLNQELTHSFIDILQRYRTYGLNTLESMAKLYCINRKPDKATLETLRNEIQRGIIAADEDKIEDCLCALSQLADNECNIQELIILTINYVEASQNEHINRHINFIVGLLKQGEIGTKAVKKIPNLLSILSYAISEYKIGDEYKTEIRYYANMLAGVFSQFKPDDNSVKLWKAITDNDETFNDVRQGFYKGQKIECIFRKSD